MVVREPQGKAEIDWTRRLWEREWGGLTMISRGTAHHLAGLSRLVAVAETEDPVGLITWAIQDDSAEIVSLNAVRERRGIGSELLTACEDGARQKGVRRLWLITTNDNIRALAFYQKRGYRIEAVFPGAVDEARREKSGIPLAADNGIPIHDELLLAKCLASVD